VLAWCIDRIGIENKNTVKYPYPTGMKKYEILIIGASNSIKKDDTIPTLVNTKETKFADEIAYAKLYIHRLTSCALTHKFVCLM
jgi:hypothetical protein